MRISVELSTAEVERYQNTISGTLGHRSITTMTAFDFLLVFYSYFRPAGRTDGEL